LSLPAGVAGAIAAFVGLFAMTWLTNFLPYVHDRPNDYFARRVGPLLAAAALVVCAAKCAPRYNRCVALSLAIVVALPSFYLAFQAIPNLNSSPLVPLGAAIGALKGAHHIYATTEPDQPCGL
jgi:hypothetical protein